MLAELIILALCHILLTGAAALVLRLLLRSLHYVLLAILSSLVITSSVLLGLLALSDRHGRPVTELLLESLTDQTSVLTILGAFAVGSAGSAPILRLLARARRLRELK